MYDYAARMYDATIGRFVGMDPLADQDASFSPYSFCGDNPANFFDPDGLAKKKWNWKKIIKIAIAVVVVVAVVAVIAAIPVIVCPGAALAGFVGGGTGATTLGGLAAGMISSAAGAIGGAIVAAGGALLGALPAIATALTGAYIGYKTIEMSRPVSNPTPPPTPPIPDPTTPKDCNCDPDGGNNTEGFNGGFSIYNNTFTNIMLYGSSQTNGLEGASHYLTLRPGERLVTYYFQGKYTAKIIDEKSGATIIEDADIWDVDGIRIGTGQSFVGDNLNVYRNGNFSSPWGAWDIKLRPGVLVGLGNSPSNANRGTIELRQTDPSQPIRIINSGDPGYVPTYNFPK